MLVNHQSNEPTLIIPEDRNINATKEDTVSVISGVFISNINPTLTEEYNVGLTVSCNLGVLSLNTARRMTFSVGDGTEDEVMYFSGSVDAVNEAIAAITYRPLLNVYGPEIVTITVTDLMYLGTDEAWSHTQEIKFEVEEVRLDMPKHDKLHRNLLTRPFHTTPPLRSMTFPPSWPLPSRACWRTGPPSFVECPSTTRMSSLRQLPSTR